MSLSPVARQVTQSQAIPSRRMVINSASQLPNDYSTTPGGTIYSTTPGGTRIVYERAFLLQMRNSPMAKTPPKNIQYIPGVSPNKQSGLCVDNNNIQKSAQRLNSSPTPAAPLAQDRSVGHDSEQFEMDL
jgi:hypothetical protein